jgi:hypothetical protein
MMRAGGGGGVCCVLGGIRYPRGSEDQRSLGDELPGDGRRLHLGMVLVRVVVPQLTERHERCAERRVVGRIRGGIAAPLGGERSIVHSHRERIGDKRGEGACQSRVSGASEWGRIRRRAWVGSHLSLHR